MEYPSKKGEDVQDYAKNTTWNILNAYIDAHSQMLIDEYTGVRVQSIIRLKSQCVKMNISNKIRYNILFKKGIRKVGNPAIIYIKMFYNSKDLEISVGKSYSEYQLMHNFLDNFHQGGK